MYIYPYISIHVYIVHVYVEIHIVVYIYIYITILCVCIYIHVCVCMCVWMWVCVCVWMCVCKLRMHMCTHTYIYTYSIYIFICIYTHVHVHCLHILPHTHTNHKPSSAQKFSRIFIEWECQRSGRGDCCSTLQCDTVCCSALKWVAVGSNPKVWSNYQASFLKVCGFFAHVLGSLQQQHVLGSLQQQHVLGSLQQQQRTQVFATTTAHTLRPRDLYIHMQHSCICIT